LDLRFATAGLSARCCGQKISSDEGSAFVPPSHRRR